MGKFLLLFLSSVALIAISAPWASANVILEGNATDGYYATGIEGIDILGTTYNVAFVNGNSSYNDVFDGSLTFTNQTDAYAAVNAINAELNTAVSGDKVAWLVEDGGTENEFYLPYLIGPNPLTSDVRSVRSYNDPDAVPTDADYSWDIINSAYSNHNFDWEFQREQGSVIPWAVVTPVPVPAAVWLLGSGLIGLVGIRKRMKS